MGDDQRTIDQRDVFISYGHADAEWVRTFAGNMSQSGLALFFDEWDIAPGDVLVHKLDEGIASVPNGVIVVSPAALGSLWVNAEYAAMMTRAVHGKQRLIPVLRRTPRCRPCWRAASGSTSATPTAPITWRASASWSAR